MTTERLLTRPMKDSDETAFINGTADRSLRTAYGLPEDMDAATASKIFRHFCALPGAYSIVDQRTDDMIGFLLEVDPELPAGIAEGLSGKGRTLAFAVFPPYQRQGYMEETLNAYIPQLFQKQGADYIHCGHFSDNEPSSRLLQKVGFQKFAEHTIQTRIVIDRLLRRDRLQE